MEPSRLCYLRVAYHVVGRDSRLGRVRYRRPKKMCSNRGCVVFPVSSLSSVDYFWKAIVFGVTAFLCRRVTQFGQCPRSRTKSAARHFVLFCLFEGTVPTVFHAKNSCICSEAFGRPLVCARMFCELGKAISSTNIFSRQRQWRFSVGSKLK